MNIMTTRELYESRLCEQGLRKSNVQTVFDSSAVGIKGILRGWNSKIAFNERARYEKEIPGPHEIARSVGENPIHAFLEGNFQLFFESFSLLQNIVVKRFV